MVRRGSGFAAGHRIRKQISMSKVSAPTTSLDRVLQCPSLPTLPSVALELLELTRDPNVKISAIAKLVKGDVGLAGKVLKTVNSSFFGLKQPCATIDRALAFLGLNTIKSLVLGFSLIESTRGVKPGQGFDLGTYWKRSIYAAAAGKIIAEESNACDPDEAFTGSLFQDMGMFAMHATLGQEYSDCLTSAPSCHADLAAHERTRLELTHTLVGAELAAKWKFQPIIVDCVRHHHEPDRASVDSRPLVRTVMTSWMAAEVLTGRGSAQLLDQLQNRLQQWCGLAEARTRQVLERTTSAAVELAKMFEQDVGQTADVERILADARERLVEDQVRSQQRAETAEQHSRVDALTGLLNRRAFDETLSAMFKTSVAERRPMAALFIDADKFKLINDTHGHAVGDAVLREIATRTGAVVGASGELFRYGGEEFTALLPACEARQAKELAEATRRAIEASPIRVGGSSTGCRELTVTVSVGVAATDGGPVGTAEQLIQLADEAVYAAKRGGRNRVSLATVPRPSDQPRAVGAGASGKVRIALIEDDSLAAALMSASLRKIEGVEVAWVKSCREAAEYLGKVERGETAAPQILVSDNRLGDGSAREVLATARAGERTKTIPFVVVSSGIDDQVRAVLLSEGVLACFSKMEIGQSLGQWVSRIMTMAAPRSHAA